MKQSSLDTASHVQYLPDPYTYIDAPLWYHTRGLSQTASGYGARLTTARKVRLADGRTRRVYCTIWSNAGTCWIVLNGARYVVN